MTINGVIGIDNKLPWAFGTQKTDMRFFREKTTEGGVVIMGRKTFESIGSKPLKNRLNIVISNNTDFENTSELYLVRSVTEALETAEMYISGLLPEENPNPKAFIIGGSTVYAQCLDMGVISRFWVTYIDTYASHSDHEIPVPFPRNFKSDKWDMEPVNEFDKSDNDANSGTIKCMINRELVRGLPEEIHPIKDDNGWIRMIDGKPAEYGEYEVYRADAKKQHYQTWNNTGWAYNNGDTTHWRPKTPPTIF